MTWWSLRRRLTPYLFLAPFLVLFTAFLLVPLGYALNLSVYVDRLVGGPEFVGAANFSKAFGDPAFQDGVLRMLLFGVVQVPLMLGAALVFALVLDSGGVHLRRLFRLGFFVPYAVPGVVAALMWGFLFGDRYGPLVDVFEAVGLSTPNFLGSDLMLAAIGNVVTWQHLGYNMLIMYAALQAVPRELYEAAAVDGASPRQISLRIRIPMITPALLLAAIFSVIGTMQLFNEPRVLQALAPGVITDAYTPNLYAYALAFDNQQYSYSAAVSFVLGAVVFVASYAFMVRALRKEKA